MSACLSLRATLLAAALAGGIAAPAQAAPKLGAGYGDGMVLQRGLPIMLSGKSDPGEVVTATFGKDKASATANADGSFTIALPPREASTKGETLSLSARSGHADFANILIGDVILCSGQSNMELQVNRALNTWNELRLAADDGIRLLKVPKFTAAAPQDHFFEPTAWKAASSDTVGEFSAACFYMGKQLRADRPGVPVGLIHSNWGGSAARAWLTPAGVEALYGREALDQLRQYTVDPLAATQAFVPQWFDWWRANDNGREPWTDSSMLEWKTIPQFSFWNEWTGTGLDKSPAANVWLRQTFDLTPEQAGRDGKINIGAIDDMDLTFINGHPVGYTFGWGVERAYTVPAEYLHAGKNEVLIAANNMWDTGGFFGTVDRLFFTPGGEKAIPLAADWQYSIAKVPGVPPRAPWDANAGLGVMHNFMVAPLGSMRLAGIAWYQGESDVGQPDYDAKLRQLFAGWRAQFGQQARMMVVQLADFGQRQTHPVESAWAQLRQDQLDGVVADSNAALVTAIDIGEPTDIHPANKNVLGRRLAWAFEGKPMPMPQSATLADGVITVTFSGIEGGLVALGGPYPLGVELCGDAPNSCHWALGSFAGDHLYVPVEAGKPASRIRYLWSDAPIVNLYDARELPVPGFELDVK